MDEQRVEAGVAGDDFPRGPGRGVTVEHASDVFANSGQHRFFSYDRVVIIGSLSDLVNYLPLGRSQADNMPRRILTSTFSNRALANSRRTRSMSLRGSRGCKNPLARRLRSSRA